MTRTLFENEEGQKLEIFVNTDEKIVIRICGEHLQIEGFFQLNKEDEKDFFKEVSNLKKFL